MSYFQVPLIHQSYDVIKVHHTTECCIFLLSYTWWKDGTKSILCPLLDTPEIKAEQVLWTISKLSTFVENTVSILKQTDSKSKMTLQLQYMLRDFKERIVSLFDPCANAMGWGPYWPSSMEVSYCTFGFGTIIRPDLRTLLLPHDSRSDNLHACAI